jgi:3'-phosphoadenosine 5'-phosphosulfate sulfotransferase (PAPS reductase)/FAD synthetase
MKDKIAKSKSIIEQAAKKCDAMFCMFSGGRDSLCVALLAREVNPGCQLLFMESSINLPGAVKFAVEMADKLELPLHRSHPENYQGDFATVARRFGYFPTVEQPWCSGRLKIRPARAYLRKLYGRQSIAKLTGVRRAESYRRRAMYRPRAYITKDPEHAGSHLVHPILDWSDNDVLALLRAHNLAVSNPLYRVYGVSDCYWCPFYQERILERIARALPGIYQPIIKLEEELGKPALSGHKYLRHLVERIQAQPAMI